MTNQLANIESLNDGYPIAICIALIIITILLLLFLLKKSLKIKIIVISCLVLVEIGLAIGLTTHFFQVVEEVQEIVQPIDNEDLISEILIEETTIVEDVKSSFELHGFVEVDGSFLLENMETKSNELFILFNDDNSLFYEYTDKVTLLTWIIDIEHNIGIFSNPGYGIYCEFDFETEQPIIQTYCSLWDRNDLKEIKRKYLNTLLSVGITQDELIEYGIELQK